jgi:hypothetical protein
MFRLKFCGPTDTAVRVGFTKNPVQLAAKAKVRSAAHAPITLIFVARILFWDSFRPLGSGAGGRSC